MLTQSLAVPKGAVHIRRATWQAGVRRWHLIGAASGEHLSSRVRPHKIVVKRLVT
jgi:hypothetical protein